MNLLEFAKQELAMINPHNDAIQNMIEKNILEIIEVFSNQDHSNHSAAYVIKTLERLLWYKPLTALTGKDDEWKYIGDGKLQNVRCSEVFKDRETGEAYWINGKIFSDDGGQSWYGCKESRVPVTFPYIVPKESEYIILGDNHGDA